MTFPARLNGQAVVGINVYGPKPPIFVGHVNLTFYYHGIDQGTFGYNSTGTDLKGKTHPQSFPSPNMHGGVFVEQNDKAMTHYVIVSEENYHSMFSYAMSQAKLTSGRNNIRYILAGHNCADFAYQVFQHSDLTPEQKDVKRYLVTTLPPAAAYGEVRSDAYMEQNIHDPQKLADFKLTESNKAISNIRR